jgi:hypothetical protein
MGRHGRNGRDPRDRGQTLQVCAHPDCEDPGVHPAPKSRDRLRDYFWFCKAHAREYNAAWDYCRGLGQDQIDALIRQDVLWGKPTWPLGLQRAAAGGDGGLAADDPFGVFGGGARPDTEDMPPPDTAGAGGELWAMRVLDLRGPLTLTALKARYKELAKRLHPDVNGGDAEAEDKLKKINLAYAALRTSLSAKAG